METGERVVVGVNKYRIEEPPYDDILRIDEEGERRQVDHLKALKGGDGRDNKQVETALNKLTEACELQGADRQNLMPLLIDASRSYATLGEIREAMVAVYGEYREPAVF